MKKTPEQESSCSRLVSNDLLDSRAEQKRGAETPEQIAVKVLSGCVTYVPMRVIGTLELRIACAIREAVKVEREACAEIADRLDSGNNGDMADMIADEIRARIS